MRPERLIPVSARLTNGVETGQGNVVATTRVGSPATVEVAITGPASTHVLRESVIVAVPGCTSGAGDRAQMPPKAAIRPGNQVAKGLPVIDAVAHGQRLDVTFQPTEPGTYPMYFLAQVRLSEDSVSDENDRRPRRSCQELGCIIVL